MQLVDNSKPKFLLFKMKYKILKVEAICMRVVTSEVILLQCIVVSMQVTCNKELLFLSVFVVAVAVAVIVVVEVMVVGSLTHSPLSPSPRIQIQRSRRR